MVRQVEVEPILKDSQVVKIDGRFPIQLEIPTESTLSSTDIEKIAALATWEVNPNGPVGRFEGGRSVIVKREIPREIRGYDFRALQISGIGYFPGLLKNPDELIDATEVREFCSPNGGNFMEEVGRGMGRSHCENGVIVDTVPSYLACGGYTRRGLDKKVGKTREISRLNLKKMIVSPLEACGQYLGEEMVDNEGLPLGFMVVPAPNVVRQRLFANLEDKVADEIERLKRSGKEITMGNIVNFFYHLSSLTVLPFISALRELHDEGGRVHLQTHLQNLYSLDEMPYVLDWSTAEKLNGSRDDNATNRTIDMARPIDDIVKFYEKKFGMSRDELELIYCGVLYPLAMEEYARDGKRVDFITEGKIAKKELRRDPKAFEILVSWMKRKSFER